MSINNPLQISSPIIGKEEINAVIKVLKSRRIVQGELVEKFEQEFAKYVGTKYAVMTSNGTTALYLALLGVGIKEGDEVITTPFSFIASANTILYCGAKPVFIDIEKETFNLDPRLIENKITSKTKAILPVHLFGLAANMPEIIKIAKKHNLFIIEDACQSHGADINGKKTGSFGDAGCFSFYATKNITTGEGGMITTDDLNITEKTKMLRNHGMREKYHHEILGYNFRSTDIAAAIGLAQLKKIHKLNSQRIANALYLNKHLFSIPGIQSPTTPQGYSHVFHQFTITINNNYPVSREELIKRFQKVGINPQIYYPTSIPKQEIYRGLDYRDNLINCEDAAEQVLSLPIHPSVKKNDLDEMIKVLKSL